MVAAVEVAVLEVVPLSHFGGELKQVGAVKCLQGERPVFQGAVQVAKVTSGGGDAASAKGAGLLQEELTVPRVFLSKREGPGQGVFTPGAHRAGALSFLPLCRNTVIARPQDVPPISGVIGQGDPAIKDRNRPGGSRRIDRS